MANNIFSEKQSACRPGINFIFSLSVLFVLLFSASLMAQGDLAVFPKRVVFENNKKYEDLNLINNGKDTARYSISFVQIRMKPDGSFERITEPDSGQYFADSYVRIFPRNVVLAPREAQVVKLQVTKAEKLKPGEYRSHIYFRADANTKPLALGETEKPKDTTSISIRLIPIYGVTIPVIIRAGEPAVKVNLSNLSFEMANDTTPTVKMDINRTGNMSVYGDIKVEHVSPAGKVTQVGNIQGLAVYTPTPFRHTVIRLDNVAGIDYHSGKLHVVYTAQRDDKVEKYSEAEFKLN